MKKRFWLKIAAGAAVFILAALVLTGNYLVDFAIARKETVNMEVVPASATTQESLGEINANNERILLQRKAWLDMVPQEEVTVTSDDGLTLYGSLFDDGMNSHLWLLAVHGYTGRRTDMYSIASFYGKRGYRVLAPDMRGHGKSGGDFIGMGWLDRSDLLKWIDLILSRDEEAQIILHGISMGGAAVMMAAGEELPPQVKGIVEDCGYTSVWDIFADELSYLFHLPPFPVLYAADLMSKVRAGYSFREASAVRQVKKSRVPMLFIHGSEDTFVHTEMVYEVYEACPGEKELLVVDGAGHGQAYAKDPDLYFGTVFRFIEEHCL